MVRFKFNDDHILASLDLGSSSIRCAVFKKNYQRLEPISFYEKKCQVLEEGKVNNFKALIPVIGEVLEKSEKLSNTFFSEVVVGFSTVFHSFSSYGMAALSSREVSKKDQDLALETACAVPIPYQHIQLHNHAQEFCVDGKHGITNPLGLSGLRLEVEVYIITIPQFYCQDMTKVLKALGCKPKAFVSNTFAFGNHLTDFNQKKEGVCVCDIGHKSSRLITYRNGKILDMYRIPIGGEHFSAALVQQFQISPIEAQKLKECWGHVQSHLIDKEQQIELNQEEGSFLSYQIFSTTLEQVAQKLFQSIKKNMVLKNLENEIGTGYVFTGSTSLLKGFLSMAKQQLGKPVMYPEGTVQNHHLGQDYALAIAQQFYLHNHQWPSRDLFDLKRFKLKDLF